MAVTPCPSYASSDWVCQIYNRLGAMLVNVAIIGSVVASLPFLF
jgi:hypothetical protein